MNHDYVWRLFNRFLRLTVFRWTGDDVADTSFEVAGATECHGERRHMRCITYPRDLGVPSAVVETVEESVRLFVAFCKRFLFNRFSVDWVVARECKDDEMVHDVFTDSTLRRQASSSKGCSKQHDGYAHRTG